MDMETDHQESFVNLTITTTFNSFATERRYPVDKTVQQLKSMLEGITGASPSSMQLQLFNKDGTLVGPMSSSEAPLSSFGIQNGMVLQVSDPSIRVGEYEDLSKVKKFELSEEEYASRAESLRAFKQKNKMGQFDDEKQQQLLAEEAAKEAESQLQFDRIETGKRCLITVAGQPHKKGMIMFKGPTHFKPGNWVGIKYDEPLGKNDGSVDGKRYFECYPKYGAFVRPESVTVGDYPEDDAGFMEEI